MPENRGYTAQDNFDTLVARIGKRGLNLIKPLDELDPEEASRMSNVARLLGGALETRPGQVSLATAGTHHHSLGRLNLPPSSFTRFFGVDTSLYKGTSGALGGAISSGFSGNPLTFLQYRPALSGQPWMYVADSTKMVKVSSSGTVRTIGLSAPVPAATASRNSTQATIIAEFDVSDGSQAASWTSTAGTGNAAVLTDGASAVNVATDPGAATADYYSIIGLSRSLNLNMTGSQVASDDDLMRWIMGIHTPELVDNIRVYLVCSNDFDATIIPGTSGTKNTNAYWKAFQPNSAGQYLNFQQLVSDFGDNVRNVTLREEFKQDRTLLEPLDVYTLGTTNAGFGEFGEEPLRRGDFARIGNSTDTWGTIYGIIIVITVNTNQAASLTFDGFWLRGGYGPDTSELSSTPYDYRFTHYDPDTGTESNPSPIMTSTNYVQTLRDAISVSPSSFGIATYRQRIYRRGGTLPDDWYFVGTTTGDGVAFADTLSDVAIEAAGTLQTDHYQPVPTVNSSGATVLNQAVPIIFGPTDDLIFALGDPNRPGHVYWCKPGEPDHWPAENLLEVCSPSEELMAGGIYAGSAFVMSRERMYLLNPNVVSGSGVVASPTACGEGLASRWGLAVGRTGIYFVSRDGVRITTGGASELISIPIEPLFTGTTRNGYLPIDFTTPAAIKLSFNDDDLWFIYRDTGGTRRSMIYNVVDKAWRSYDFGNVISCAYSEPNNAGGVQLLLGALSAGATYTHTGFNDSGSGIASSIRTGAWDFGRPREDKMLGDIVIDANMGAATAFLLTTYLNGETTTNTTQTVTGSASMSRFMFDAFGTDPQAARNVSFDLSWTADTAARPAFNFLGCAARLDPDTTMRRATNWEELPGGEGYLYGVRLNVDSGNTQLDIEVEYTTSTGVVTSAATIQPQANGRRILMFTWNAVYAQQVRLRPTGLCESLKLYKVEWISYPEPPRIAGWNTNWSPCGILADKKIKGFLIHCDTFNVAKTWALDIDGSSAVQTGSITQNGPGVQMITFAESTGRLFRFRATDANAGKLYKWQPIFDVEPLKLDRWETQELDHGYIGWQIPTEGFFTLRSSATVTLQMIIYDQTGAVINTRSYSISSTSGAKAPRYVQFSADKGCLFKYTLTSSAPFWLYREESYVELQPFAGGKPMKVKPFGNDDLDRTRSMGSAEASAAAPGGMMDNS